MLVYISTFTRSCLPSALRADIPSLPLPSLYVSVACGLCHNWLSVTSDCRIGLFHQDLPAWRLGVGCAGRGVPVLGVRGSVKWLGPQAWSYKRPFLARGCVPLGAWHAVKPNSSRMEQTPDKWTPNTKIGVIPLFKPKSSAWLSGPSGSLCG